MNNTLKVIFATLAVLPLGLVGCNSAQGGAGIGAGVGALAGQAIGRNTSSTLIGAGAGAAAGYMIGNEMDKQSAQQQRDQMQQEIDQNRYENQRQAEARRQAEAQRRRQQENDRRGGGSQWNSEPGFDSGGGGSRPTSSSSWEFVGEGASRDVARRDARGEARRAIADRTDYWADRSLAAARREFNLRNPAQFQNHFNLASDAMLQAAQMESSERRESGRVIFTLRVNLRALRAQFREYLEEADQYVNPSERQAYRQWCNDLTLGA